MAIELGAVNLEMIVDGYRLFGRQYPASESNHLVAEIYVSVGTKERDSEGNILTGPMGQEHWSERYSKTIHVRRDHLHAFLVELSQSTTYHMTPVSHTPTPDGVDPVAWQLYAVDANSTGEWYALAAWMLATGRAKV